VGTITGALLILDITVRIPSGPDRIAILGPAERNLKMIRETLGVRVTARDDAVRISGDRRAVTVARGVLEHIQSMEKSEPLNRKQVLDLIAERASRADLPAADSTMRSAGSFDWDGRLDVYAGGLPVKAKTANQQAYLEAIRDNDLVFGIGPAGTGKTYLAVAAAVHLLKTGRCQKVILARPAVEAGEKLGFLPGDLLEKVNPYLRPLLDALHDMMDYGSIQRLMASDVIEIVPLAFMRGRTLNGALIILDEAQNSTRGQMKMFLTRMGHGSKMIVTGDTTQIDLPDPADSGLVDAARRLRRVKGCAFVTLTPEDVVRHPLVSRIIAAYGEDEAAREHARAVREALEGDLPGSEEPGPTPGD